MDNGNKFLFGETIRIETIGKVFRLPIGKVEHRLVIEFRSLEGSIGDLAEARPFPAEAQRNFFSVAAPDENLVLEIGRVGRRELPHRTVIVIGGGSPQVGEIDRVRDGHGAAGRALQAPHSQGIVAPIVGAFLFGVRESSGVAFGAPLELVGARAENGVHHPAHGLAVLRVERSADHLHFLQDRSIDGERRLVVERVVHSDAIDLVLNFAEPAPAEMSFHDAGLQVHDIVQLLHGKRFDLLPRDRRLRAGDLEIDRRALRRDDDLFERHHR